MITLLNKNKLFLYCLVVIILCSFFASLIQTSFGKVDVKLMNLKTPDGQNLVYDLYKPSIATENDKQPFIVVVPGFQRSKEALSNIAIELSRRGYVVALIDPYAQGMSSSSLSRLAATTQGYGMFALVDYAYAENFSFVDINKIGSTGHSMGGNAAIRGADYFGKEAIKSGKKSKLDSVYISGYVLTLQENILRDSKSNMGVSYALYDEGAFRNDLQGWDAGNMKIAPESLRTVNSVLPKDKKVTEVELGKYYGDRSNNTLRVIFNEELLHPFQPYNKEATKNQLDYFDKVFGAPISINSNNQIWQYKELFTLINMIVSLLMLIPIAKLFLSLSFYKDIVKDIPASLKEKTSSWVVLKAILPIYCGCIVDQDNPEFTIGKSGCTFNIRTDLKNHNQFLENELAICPENAAVLSINQSPVHLTEYHINENEIKLHGHSVMMGYLDHVLNKKQFRDGGFFLNI